MEITSVTDSKGKSLRAVRVTQSNLAELCLYLTKVKRGVANVRYCDGAIYIYADMGFNTIMAGIGDWLVEDTDRFLVVSDDEFSKHYTEEVMPETNTKVMTEEELSKFKESLTETSLSIENKLKTLSTLLGKKVRFRECENCETSFDKLGTVIGISLDGMVTVKPSTFTNNKPLTISINNISVEKLDYLSVYKNLDYIYDTEYMCWRVYYYSTELYEVILSIAKSNLGIGFRIYSKKDTEYLGLFTNEDDVRDAIMEHLSTSDIMYTLY